jgi:hypothetical protein
MTTIEIQKCDRRTALGTIAAAACGALLPKSALAEASPISRGSWTLAVLPDTQVYARKYPRHYDAQTQWIADHAKTHNIRFVLHEGDITDNNVERQWDNAHHSMNILNGVVPYAMAPGNHDYGPNGRATDRKTMFNESRYFGPKSAYAKQKCVGGFFEPKQTDNSFHTFSAAGNDWLVLALEWAPRDAVVEWANKVVEAHPKHLAMLVTHAYMYNDDTRYDWAAKGPKQSWNPHAYGVAKLPGETVNDGQQLWDKLISVHENFRFAFNGHVLGDGTGRMTSTGEKNHVVHQILANYQFKKEGGQGDMRLLEFKSDGDILVRTYSPVLDRYDQADDQEFNLKLNQSA